MSKKSYKTCYVFRLDDHYNQVSSYVLKSGELQRHHHQTNNLQNKPNLLLKMFDKETADTVLNMLKKETKINQGYEEWFIEEIEVDILYELELYPFVRIMMEDMRVYMNRMGEFVRNYSGYGGQ